jgi:hypothetical protein
VLVLKERLLLFIFLSTQSGNFWIHPLIYTGMRVIQTVSTLLLVIIYFFSTYTILSLSYTVPLLQNKLSPVVHRFSKIWVRTQTRTASFTSSSANRWPLRTSKFPNRWKSEGARSYYCYVTCNFASWHTQKYISYRYLKMYSFRINWEWDMQIDFHGKLTRKTVTKLKEELFLYQTSWHCLSCKISPLRIPHLLY